MHLPELRFLDQLAVESAFQFHHVQKHLIVRAAWEQNLACVKLEQRAPYRPHIDAGIIW